MASVVFFLFVYIDWSFHYHNPDILDISNTFRKDLPNEPPNKPALQYNSDDVRGRQSTSDAHDNQNIRHSGSKTTKVSNINKEDKQLKDGLTENSKLEKIRKLENEIRKNDSNVQQIGTQKRVLTSKFIKIDKKRVDAFKPWRPPRYAFQILGSDSFAKNISARKNSGGVAYKTILIWNNDDAWSRSTAGRGRFWDCPVYNCESILDRGKVNTSDAIVFSTFALRNYVNDQPTVHRPDQPWILSTREPPWEILSQLGHQFDDKFDLIDHHRTDADVVNGYGYLREMSQREKLQVELKQNYATGRSNLVIWFVSHCNTASFRELYVEELQKHVRVDVYGGCSRLKCGATGIHNYNMTCVAIKLKYKFYLSFENTLCTDYITEKLWWALEEGIVPIVLGGANYSKFLPDGAYINVKDFSSPEALANYLKMLDANDAKYNQYFTWRLKYEVSKKFAGPCQLCYLLNKKYRSPNNYSDLHKWFNRCENPRDFYSGIANGVVTKINKGIQRDFNINPF